MQTNEIFEVANFLSKIYNVHLLSNMINLRTQIIRKTYDLSFFTNTFFSNEVNLSKPDSEIFELMLKKINAKSDECLFIDDSIKNINTAKRLGFNTIHFTSIKNFYNSLMEFNIDMSNFKIQISSGGIIIKNNDLLLIKESNDFIEYPKGHVEEDEDLLETAYRGIKEEANITKDNLQLIGELNSYVRKDVATQKKKIIHLFLFEYLDNKKKNELWVSVDEAEKILSIKEDSLFLKYNKYKIKKLLVEK